MPERDMPRLFFKELWGFFVCFLKIIEQRKKRLLKPNSQYKILLNKNFIINVKVALVKP